MRKALLTDPTMKGLRRRAKIYLDPSSGLVVHGYDYAAAVFALTLAEDLIRWVMGTWSGGSSEAPSPQEIRDLAEGIRNAITTGAPEEVHAKINEMEDEVRGLLDNVKARREDAIIRFLEDAVNDAGTDVMETGILQALVNRRYSHLTDPCDRHPDDFKAKAVFLPDTKTLQGGDR